MIKLSRLTDYAISLLTQMVGEEKPIWAAPELAEKTGLPLPTVAKILKRLNKSGIVTAQRGAFGGYRLAVDPAAISIARMIEAMDGPIALTECSDGSDHSCRVEALCPMHGGWNKVNRAIRQALANVSLADMAAGQMAALMPSAAVSDPASRAVS